LPGPRWLLLGDMGEVGTEGPRLHAEVGAAVRAAGIEQFWAAGALCAQAGAQRHFSSVAELVAALPQADAAASVLVKGSRFMKMEQVVQALQREAAHAA
jgi:UDP-N-acetylmuramoyl-tripeptide--D-alanyl-D-alanine ligase